jgi:1-deoxy-D-xylulose-5-phosphate synthase
VLCIDRAGLVGSDGPTHHGLNDIAYCRAMPGFVVMAPKDESELPAMLDLALGCGKPAAIRYPREVLSHGGAQAKAPPFGIGEAEVLVRGKDAAIIAYGAMVRRSLEAASILRAQAGVDVTVVNARFAQPLDGKEVGKAVANHRAVLVAEDHSVTGGFGSAVIEALAAEGVAAAHVRLAGVPGEPVAHATREEQLARCALDGRGLASQLRALLNGRRR